MRIFVTPPVKVDILMNECCTIIKWKIVVLKKIGNKNLLDQKKCYNVLKWNDPVKNIFDDL